MARLVLDEAALGRLATDPDSTLGQRMRRTVSGMAEAIRDRQQARMGTVPYATTSGLTRVAGRGLVGTVRMEPTRPHRIVPVRARVLRFSIDGEVVFSARVRHPGSSVPVHYLTDALDAARL